MTTRLADDRIAVMTRDTGPQHFAVIDENGRYPGRGTVAGSAFVRGGYVGGSFAGGGGAVMAGNAVTAYYTVIHQRRGYKALGSVANVALLNGNDMS